MRRSERLPIELSVTWTRAGREIPCSAVDINSHGMFLRTEEQVEPESLLHLRVSVPERVLEMFVTARFVGKTTSGQGIGVEIFLIDDLTNCNWLAFYETLCAEHAQSRKTVTMGA